MKEYILKYLDKRYPIVDGIAQFKDNNPIRRMIDLFGLDGGEGDSDYGSELLVSWLASRVGDTYGIHFLSNGEKKWFKDGKLHREDGPAIIKGSGEKRWYLDDKNHKKKVWKRIVKLNLDK